VTVSRSSIEFESRSRNWKTIVQCPAIDAGRQRTDRLQLEFDHLAGKEQATFQRTAVQQSDKESCPKGVACPGGIYDLDRSRGQMTE
jgi:hypothetical protein